MSGVGFSMRDFARGFIIPRRRVRKQSFSTKVRNVPAPKLPYQYPSLQIEAPITASDQLSQQGNQKAIAYQHASTVMKGSDALEFVNNYLTTLPELNLFNQTFQNFKNKSLEGLTMLTPSLLNTRWEKYKKEIL